MKKLLLANTACAIVLPTLAEKVTEVTLIKLQMKCGDRHIDDGMN